MLEFGGLNANQHCSSFFFFFVYTVFTEYSSWQNNPENSNMCQKKVCDCCYTLPLWLICIMQLLSSEFTIQILYLRLFKCSKELIPIMVYFCLYSLPIVISDILNYVGILQSPLEISQQDVKSSVWQWIVSTGKAFSTNISSQNT